MIPMPAWSRCGWLWLAATVFAAPPEDARLAGIIKKMADNLARLPNYTCTQTIDRWRRGEPCPRCEYSDRLRLEVAVVGKRERYAWPGAQAFEDQDIFGFVGHGSILTGDFAGFARGVFLNDKAVYSYAGETKLGGRRTFRYNFNIPVGYSGFRAQAGQAQANVGYFGSFWVDAETLDVLRLDFQTAEIPRQVAIEVASASILYGRTQIGNSGFLLPQTTETTILSRNGIRSRNLTRYGACHQYVGESTIRFGESGEPSEVPAPQSGPATPASAPPRLSLETFLESPINLAECAIGDAVTLVVASPAHSGDFVVPKGARLHGRIVRMVAYLRPQRLTTLGLRVSTLEFDDRRFEFRGALRNLSLIAGNLRLQQPRIQMIGPDALVFIGPTQPTIPKGSNFYWTTTPPEKQ